MTVAELRGLLAAQVDDAQVFIFDTPRHGRIGTLSVNCVMSTNGGRAVILEHDLEEAERRALISQAEQAGGHADV